MFHVRIEDNEYKGPKFWRVYVYEDKGSYTGRSRTVPISQIPSYSLYLEDGEFLETPIGQMLRIEAHASLTQQINEIQGLKNIA